ncbi:MAG: DMT family transporter [Alphaproteobacteria bacterium]|nr:DMT family transporter [Alphaproteobacteria bacterium]
MPAALPIHELAALVTALCWAITSLVSAGPAGHLGAFAFNRLRQTSVALLLAAYVALSGRWHALSIHDVGLLLLSGAVGIFVGDTLLFTAMNRLGPRRTGVLFALNAPMAAILGWALLGESLPLAAALGVVLSACGVMLAILFGGRPGQSHHLESIKGPLWAGVTFGLCAALGQACGSIIARPLMQAGIDPFAASMLRVGMAAACLTTLMALPLPAVQPRGPLTWPVALLTIFTGVLAMGVGMTLLLFALSGGKTGIISTLSATSPVLILPMLWLRTGQRPAAGAWAGALCVVAGMGLIFLGR